MSSLHVADQIIILTYLAVVLGLGLWSGRRVKDLEDYAVAGRGYSALIIAMTLSASFIGGGFTMGNAEKVFTLGIINIAVLWGFSLKEILVATFIAPRMGHFPNAISVGDVMAINYGKIGQVTTGIFSVMLCAGILGAQVGAMGYMFNLFLGLPFTTGILLGMGIVIVYDTLGGMRAVVSTDILQFCILAAGIPLALFLGLRQVGSLEALAASVPSGHFNLFGQLSKIQILSLFLTFMLGETLVPPYVVRLFLSRHTRATSRGTLWSGLFSIPFFAIAGGIGLVALALNPSLNPNLALPYVVQTVLPIGLRGLVVAGIIAVVMSSADSFLNSASVAFINDIVNPLLKRPLQPKRGLLGARLATLVTGSISVVFAIRIKSLLDILIYAYNFWSPIILVPLVATLLGVRADTRAFCAGAAAGLGGVFFWNRILGTPGGFDGLLVGVFANLLVFSVLARLSRQPLLASKGVA